MAEADRLIGVAERGATRSGLLLAGLYVLFAGFYIIVSTVVIAWLHHEAADILAVEMVKGLLFVFLTGLGLFFGARHVYGRMHEQCREIERQRESILHLDERASAGLLASAIAHDSNNLLTTAKMALELIRISKDPAKRDYAMESLEQALDEMGELNFRLVRGSVGERAVERKLLALDVEVDRVFRFLGEDHPIRRLKLERVTEGEVWVYLNRHLFFQAILNLLSNVLRHAGAEGPIRLEIRQVGDRVLLALHDSGPGVPEEMRQRVFEPFHTTHPDGVGLGLSSVRSVAHLHQGTVTCSESPLGGACFTLDFPAASAGEPVPQS